MGNLVVFYSRNKDILKIVAKYKETYQASLYEIETVNNISFMDKFSSVFLGNNIPIKRCNLNIASYEKIILVSPLWFGNVPRPVKRFLEQQTGKINSIIYVLYNNNKEDKEKEFDKLDKIINLRRSNSYFVTVNKKDIHVRVYQ